MKKYVGMFVCLVGLLLFCVWWYWPDGVVHVVFCDVGQGDGILIWKGFTQLLVDGGPDDKILDCLGRHVPFFDRTIDMAMVTHPQADHMNGITFVLQRYRVNYLFLNPEEQRTEAFLALKHAWENQALKPVPRYTGSVVRFFGAEFRTVWPAREWVNAHMVGTLSDGTDLNGFGIVGIFSYGDFDLLLTADADVPVEPLELGTGMLKDIDVLKVPHHGSKTGMLPEWLNVVRPELSVISSGKGNRYGHPSREAIQMLTGMGSKVLRTDQLGDVEIVTDGKSWWVKD